MLSACRYPEMNENSLTESTISCVKARTQVEYAKGLNLNQYVAGGLDYARARTETRV